MVAILGQPRSGKSFGNMMIGEMVDINGFTADNVAFIPQDYIDLIRKKKEGSYIVFDEPGAEWSNRRFMSVANILLNSTHITFGSRLINVGWAMPSLKNVDVTAERLVNYVFTTLLPPYPRGTAKLYESWMDSYEGTSGRKYLGTVFFFPPFKDNPEELKKYLQKKSEYQDKRYEEYYISFAEKAGKSTGAKLSKDETMEIAKSIADNPAKFVNKSSINEDLISMEMNISKPDAKNVKILAERLLRQKGIRLKDMIKRGEN
jgi:hypothetical protein